MFLIRPLIYKDKKLDDFEIESGDSIFKRFYDVLQTLDGTKVTDLNVEKNITDMINDACYICTLALIVKRPALLLGHFRELCNQKKMNGTYFSKNEIRQDAVMCMVYILLDHCCENNDRTKNLMFVIDKDLRERSNESNEIYKSFFYACESFHGFLYPGYFKQITLTPLDLKEMYIDWKAITHEYDKESIINLVSYWKDPNQRNIVIDAIETTVNNSYFDDGLPF